MILSGVVSHLSSQCLRGVVLLFVRPHSSNVLNNSKDTSEPNVTVSLPRCNTLPCGGQAYSHHSRWNREAPRALRPWVSVMMATDGGIFPSTALSVARSIYGAFWL